MTKELYRRELAQFKPYVQGKPIEAVRREYGLDRIEKLASNENQFGPSPKALDAIRAELPELIFYPETYPFDLMKELSQMLGIRQEQLVVGSGGEGLLWQVALTFINEGDEIVVADPTFDVYRIATSILGGKTVQVPMKGLGYDIDGMLGAVNEKTKLFFVCNPNNPTGHVASQAELDRIVRELPEDVVLFLDEAYYELAAVSPDYPKDNIALIGRRPNTLVLRSFSKTYGLAGVRFGYIITSPDIAQKLGMVGPSFKLNRLAIAAARGAIEDTEYRDWYAAENAKARQTLLDYYQTKGWVSFPSYSNFIWTDTGLDSQRFFEELQKRGVIIRPGYLWGERWKTWFRISTGTPEQMRFFIDKTEEVLAL
ncbi:MAG: aminotransferase class I/II-fold pyridoxal phosphate-dependent enzyme [Clostridiales Family XIII bacterium]|jgi:histidinol-phosphate aminotransferase|nr:aminotransferase class I/II-fold pyridoxal phosphate-dependent enzyme [Clostridiales Family XIII bacterium]